jgi:hypothetical protein
MNFRYQDVIHLERIMMRVVLIVNGRQCMLGKEGFGNIMLKGIRRQSNILI